MQDCQAKQRVVKDVICPNCYKHLQSPAIIQRPADRYGRMVRTYFGWCFACNAGCEVVQFFKNSRWHIEKHRPYSSRPLAWQKVNTLPEPAPVVTGPGGDFDKEMELAPVHILNGVHSVLLSVTETVRQLAIILGLKKNDQLPGQ